VLSLWKTHRRSSIFPLAALLEKLDALEALEDGTLAADGGVRLEAIVLGHLGIRLKIVGAGN
jgi:hypothetical protein